MQMDKTKPLQLTLGGLQQRQKLGIVVRRLPRCGHRLFTRLSPYLITGGRFGLGAVHHDPDQAFGKLEFNRNLLTKPTPSNVRANRKSSKGLAHSYPYHNTERESFNWFL